MDASGDSAKRARGFLLVAVGVTVALYLVPYGEYAIYPLMLLSTFAHEMGHGLAALMVGGEFHSFVMHPDGSGMAATATPQSRLAVAFVSAGGLVGPSVLGAMLFAASTRGKVSRVALWIAGAGAAVACVLVVRNLFGWMFVGMVAVVCLVLARKASESIAQIATAFVAVQMALSVYSRGDYLFAQTALTAAGPAPSDVAAMASALWLPYWFWGGVCAAISVTVLVVGLWAFWRSTRVVQTSA